MSWIGEKEPDGETVKVTVICRLSSTPLIKTGWTFQIKCVLPGETKELYIFDGSSTEFNIHNLILYLL